MDHARPLPAYLISRFQGWRATTYQDNKAWYRRLAASGQHPRAMVISCCDSRVHVTSIFGADEGEFFIHRNIAGLVPIYSPDGGNHGTSAAVEYAVTSLGVAHIVVLGHSNCGGVRGCHDMCCGMAPELEMKSSFVGRWMDILRPGFQRVADLPPEEILQRMQALPDPALSLLARGDGLWAGGQGRVGAASVVGGTHLVHQIVAAGALQHVHLPGLGVGAGRRAAGHLQQVLQRGILVLALVGIFQSAMQCVLEIL